MRRAIDETNRRRAKQVAYNTERGVDPQPLRKKINEILERVYAEASDTLDTVAVQVGGSGRNASRGKRAAGEPGRARVSAWRTGGPRHRVDASCRARGPRRRQPD